MYSYDGNDVPENTDVLDVLESEQAWWSADQSPDLKHKHKIHYYNTSYLSSITTFVLAVVIYVKRHVLIYLIYLPVEVTFTFI